MHEHTVTNDNNSIKFTYQLSRKFNPNRDKKSFTHETSEKRIDSSKTELSILIYRDNKQKFGVSLKSVLRMMILSEMKNS